MRSDRMSRPMPMRIRPICSRSRRDVDMNRTVPATRQSGTSGFKVEAEKLDHQRRADIGAQHGQQSRGAADDAGAGE